MMHLRLPGLQQLVCMHSRDADRQHDIQKDDRRHQHCGSGRIDKRQKACQRSVPDRAKHGKGQRGGHDQVGEAAYHRRQALPHNDRQPLAMLYRKSDILPKRCDLWIFQMLILHFILLFGIIKFKPPVKIKIPY